MCSQKYISNWADSKSSKIKSVNLCNTMSGQWRRLFNPSMLGAVATQHKPQMLLVLLNSNLRSPSDKWLYYYEINVHLLEIKFSHATLIFFHLCTISMSVLQSNLCYTELTISLFLNQIKWYCWSISFSDCNRTIFIQLDL